ncbi:RING-H2 finger protein ATL47 [Zea mays]|uniref:RING-type E3 ubiquitin transferase n=1 Tax=Zea mays TaxID=4577 RepID=A0A3L6DBW5_MAIZE|nr:RING-H2 finger protein ATL47 [Zea mays]
MGSSRFTSLCCLLAFPSGNASDPCTSSGPPCKLPSTEKLPLLAARLKRRSGVGSSEPNEPRGEMLLLLLGLATGLAAAAAGEAETQGGSGAVSGGGHGPKVSPAVLFVVAVAAVVLLVSCLLHLVVRLLLIGRLGRARARGGGGDGEESALQRQLRQLFHLHDAGLEQDVIDALPVFLFREVVVGAGSGAKEAFDCAVCLCEFAGEDRQRLLPPCGHAFHAGCIDTWLLSSSTCPLCQRALGGGGWEREEDAAAAVLPVRLGKFRKNLSSAAAGPVGVVVSRASEAGDPSGSGLDARRCYSMGSYQYVLAEASVQVSVHRRHGGGRGRSGFARASVSAFQ